MKNKINTENVPVKGRTTTLTGRQWLKPNKPTKNNGRYGCRYSFCQLCEGEGERKAIPLPRKGATTPSRKLLPPRKLIIEAIPGAE